MRVCGVDPGAQGAFAVVDTTTRQLVDWMDMPVIDTGKERYVDPAVVLDFIERWAPERIVVERLHAMPVSGSIGNFQSGATYGSLLAALKLALVPTETVPPGHWKKRAGLLKQDKGGSLDLARQTFGFPDCLKRKKDDGRAEAALIALYGWKVEIARAA